MQGNKEVFELKRVLDLSNLDYEEAPLSEDSFLYPLNRFILSENIEAAITEGSRYIVLNRNGRNFILDLEEYNTEYQVSKDILKAIDSLVNTPSKVLDNEKEVIQSLLAKNFTYWRNIIDRRFTILYSKLPNIDEYRYRIYFPSSDALTNDLQLEIDLFSEQCILGHWDDLFQSLHKLIIPVGRPIEIILKTDINNLLTCDYDINYWKIPYSQFNNYTNGISNMSRLTAIIKDIKIYEKIKDVFGFSIENTLYYKCKDMSLYVRELICLGMIKTSIMTSRSPKLPTIILTDYFPRFKIELLGYFYLKSALKFIKNNLTSTIEGYYKRYREIVEKDSCLNCLRTLQGTISINKDKRNEVILIGRKLVQPTDRISFVIEIVINRGEEHYNLVYDGSVIIDNLPIDTDIKDICDRFIVGFFHYIPNKLLQNETK